MSCQTKEFVFFFYIKHKSSPFTNFLFEDQYLISTFLAGSYQADIVEKINAICPSEAQVRFELASK